MCGIVGKINFNNTPVSKEEIKKMTDKLIHRGPDTEGAFVKNNVGLGHRRLSIIDLSSNGQQPMPNKTGNLWIVFNGEIYNYKELREKLETEGIEFESNTDTEVILYLYQKYGIDCLDLLRGMFAFAIYDNDKKEIFLARDRLGKKPLKYYIDENTFIFASELKAILTNPEVKKEPDWNAIDEYLTYKYVPSPKTGFKNIYKLAPAHYSIIKENGKQTINKYWDLYFDEKFTLDEEEWKNRIKNELITATQLRLMSEVPLGAHLSGGIDSSLIVAILAKDLGMKTKTFSIGFKEKKYNELPYAKMIANRYDTEHHEYILEPKNLDILEDIVYHYEEPYADASAIPSWYLAEFTKKHVTVALNGDGGDENFAGYERYDALKYYYTLNKIPAKYILANISRICNQITNKEIFDKGYRTFLYAEASSPLDFYMRVIEYFSPVQKNDILSKKLKDKITMSSWKIFTQKYFLISAEFSRIDQLLYTGIKTHLPDDLLAKVDIASMAHSLEARSPFLDHKFMELTAKIPENLKMKGHNKKYILKKIAEDYLPHDCINRPKKGFTVPLKHWFKGELYDYLEKNVLDHNFIKHGFNENKIKAMISDHRNHRVNYENQLYSLLMLSLWFKRWF